MTRLWWAITGWLELMAERVLTWSGPAYLNPTHTHRKPTE